MVLWRHVNAVSAQKVLIYSPDTDVYNIGLSFIADYLQMQTEIIIQINALSNDNKYLNLNNLAIAFKQDPDLASLCSDKVVRIMQTLYIVTGCDYVSFVRHIGKKTFDIFFQYASFINGTQMVGCLSNTFPTNSSTGFLACVRLFGTVYFKKHLAVFSARHKVATPAQFFLFF